MSTPWSLERMIYERHRAERLARSLVRVVVHYREVTPRYVIGEDFVTIELNPYVSYATYVAKSNAPRWAKDWCKDRKQNYDGKDRGNQDEKVLITQAYAQLESVIIRRRGYDGYIQGALPF